MRLNYKSIAERRNGRWMTKQVHTIVAERALGKPLPKGAVVHHVDKNPCNNDPTNLVICPNQKYHLMLHARERALDACGNASWVLCLYCGKYDDPEAMYKQHTSYRHRKCFAAYMMAWKKKSALGKEQR